MGIFTRTGDRGRTSLFSGERVTKSHPGVEACGELDELNSHIGVVIGLLPADAADLGVELKAIQSDLFQAGAWLSTSSPSASGGLLKEMDNGRIGVIERAIDRMERQLPPLRSFILPGGHLSGAVAHVARAVCRRAERRVVSLRDAGGPDSVDQLEIIMVFLNRLSDYLFVLSRYVNQVNGVADNPWNK